MSLPYSDVFLMNERRPQRLPSTRRAVAALCVGLMLLCLGISSAYIIGAWLRGIQGEEGGFIFILFWPFTLVVSGSFAVAALHATRLWATQRGDRAVVFILAIWLGDFVLWFFVFPNLSWLDNSSVLNIASIVAFDVAVLIFVGRFLLQGSPYTILGR